MSCLDRGQRVALASRVAVALLPARLRRPLLGLLLGVSLVGCAQQRIREESEMALREGRYERAVAGLEAGIKAHPDSVLLRSGLIQARSEAFARLLAEAASARAANKPEEAEATLLRAQQLDPSDKRVRALLDDLDTEKRQRQVLGEAEALATEGQPDAALRRLSQALKDNPRQPDLLAMQRRLEMDARQGQARAGQLLLAERRPISLDFRDAGLRTVLDVVTRHSGINFVLDKDVRADIRVTVLLRGAKVEDAIDLIVGTNQLAKKVLDERTVLIYPNTPDKQREHQEQVVRVFHLASGDAKGAAAFLRAMLKVREPFVDERSNMLALRETPEVIELAERMIALYDTQEPEVLMELEVLEVRRSRLTDLGLKFPDTFSLSILGPGGASGGLNLDNLRNVGRDRVGVGVGNLLVNLKREVGDFTMLANPRIRAKNREKAKVLVGEKVPVITTTTGQAGFVSDSVTYLDVGLKLDVEPTVYPDDEVAIRVALEVSSVSREVRTGSGTLAYQIGTRNASTQLRLRDGETQLLAGLISNEDRSSSSRLPGLGDLPVAGRLFSSQRDDGQRTELVLAITPRILRNARQPEAHRAEVWVGTEAQPRSKAVAARQAGVTPGTGAGTAAPAVASPSDTGSGTGMGPDAGQPTNPRAVWQVPKDVKAGEEFVATLVLESSSAIRGASLRMQVDPAQLDLLSVDEGAYFKQGEVSTSFSQSVDAGKGLARAGLIRGGGSGMAGRAAMLAVKIKALRPGVSEASTILSLTAANGNELLPAVPALRVEVK